MKTHKKVSFNILLLNLIVILFSCGKTSVSIDKDTYEPKIVINGLLYPHKKVSNVKIMRNFPVGEEINLNNLSLTEAEVSITDLSNGVKYQLKYDLLSDAFCYDKDNLSINYGKKYRLDVKANLDNKTLYASAITETPLQGMKILRDSSIIGTLFYRQKDVEGNLINPTISYYKSDNAEFYLASIVAKVATVENFIYENPPGMDIKKALEKGADIKNFQYTSTWDMRYDNGSDIAKMVIDWFNFWFYSEYRIIFYAADKNYYHYFLTAQYVQEIDGNLHQPIFDIEGDGIGYFGSAITDTVYVKILKK